MSRSRQRIWAESAPNNKCWTSPARKTVMSSIHLDLCFSFGLRSERTHSRCKQCRRIYNGGFCAAKCLLGKYPKPLCSAFFNAGCASRRDAFYPMIRSGSLRTCIRCDAASAREAYFIRSGTSACPMDAFSSCPSFRYTLYGEDAHDTLYLSAIEPLSFSSPGCSREHHPHRESCAHRW